jgi:hypothetical protein
MEIGDLSFVAYLTAAKALLPSAICKLREWSLYSPSGRGITKWDDLMECSGIHLRDDQMKLNVRKCFGHLG